MSTQQYRRHAAECLEIAESTGNPQIKSGLIAMAQSWLDLALQAEKNLNTALVYETPEPHQQVAQQQQQPQKEPEKEDEARRIVARSAELLELLHKPRH
jgi:hypothetical protein